MRFSSAGGLALAVGAALAHPGHDLTEEIAERRTFLSNVKRASLAHCSDKLRARGVVARNVARRSALLDQARVKRSIKRDVDTVLAESHDRTDLGYTLDTDPATIFGGNNSCVLTPEVTQGPYYVSGESVRRNLIEDQEGLDIVLDYQVIDVDTCEPVPGVYLEMWHCNSTGVYSGIVASGNGDSSDESNINNTWLRGIQQTDSDGVAQFESLFPGHYTSRTTHIHLMVHYNATLYSNNTLGSTITASHVGQAFFDQDLISQVETLEPYNSNTQELTTNAEDGILSEEAATEGVDPLMEYTLLGDDISDGLFAWMAFGINTTLTQAITPAAFLYAEGGVANADAGGGPGGPGGPGGSGPPNGTAPGSPSGSPPAGFDPSGSSSSALVASSSQDQSSATSLVDAPSGTESAHHGAPSGTGSAHHGAPSGTGSRPDGSEGDGPHCVPHGPA